MHPVVIPVFGSIAAIILYDPDYNINPNISATVTAVVLIATSIIAG
jgi:hypothetical protein